MVEKYAEESFGDYFRRLRRAKGFKTQKELSQASGISQTTLSRIEDGTQMPQPDTLKALAKTLDISHSELMIVSGYLEENLNIGYQQNFDFSTGDIKEYTYVRKEPEEAVETKHKITERKKRQNKSIDFIKIPIFGEIRAGYDSLVQESIVGYEYVDKNTVRDGNYFYLIVKGDSMIDEGIREGMKVLVKSQNNCEHGKIGVVLVNGDEATLKRVFYQGDTIILQAANRDIQPRVLPINEVRIQGQVKQVVFDV